MAYIRQVKTKSGATAVQIAHKVGGQLTRLEHLGSAHNPKELATLISLAKERLRGNQMFLFPDHGNKLQIKLKQSYSHLLFQVLNSQYQLLGFSQLKDLDFANLCVARIVEPTSKLDSLRVLADLGANNIGRNQLYRCLQRVAYRGLLSCGECSCKITADEKTKTNKGNGFVHRWVYYHCTHFKPCAQRGAVREETIESDVISLLGGLKLGPNTVEWLKNKLKEDHQDEIKFRNNALNSLKQGHDRINKRLDEIYDDKLDGVIDQATYFRKRQEFLTEREDIEKQIKNHGKADDIYKDFGCLVLDVAQRAGQIYKVRKPEEKQYLCNFVFSNLSLMNKNLQFSFQLIFEAIKNYQKTKDELRDMDSNHDR